MSLPELFAALPDAFAGAFDPQAPWLLLGEPLDAAVAAGGGAIAEAVPATVHLLGEGISIGAGARLGPGTVIEGPAWIGPGAELRPGAYVRAGSWIGAGAVVGASTEVKRSILLPGAKAPHLAYVGDSILGSGVNLGAGTVLSNFRHDGGDISIPHAGGRLATGRRKLGAVLGDDVATGCNSVLHPGVVVGRGSQIYPGLQVRAGVYPAGVLLKLRQQIETVELQSGSG